MATKTTEAYREKLAAGMQGVGPPAGGFWQNKGMNVLGGGILGGNLLNIDELTSPIMQSFGYRMNRAHNDGLGGLMTRVHGDELAAETGVREITKAFSVAASDAAVDAASSVYGKLKNSLVDSPARKAVLAKLRKEDDIIGGAPITKVLEAYHSMARFAPTLSTDANAAKSFLREAVQHEGGLDYMSIKGLADAESAVTGDRR